MPNDTELEPLICEERTLTDGKGHVITELVPRCGEPPEGFARLLISRQMMFEYADGSPGRVAGQFFFDSNDPVEAFREYPAMEVKAKQKLEDEVRRAKKKLVIANNAPTQNGRAHPMRFDPNA